MEAQYAAVQRAQHYIDLGRAASALQELAPFLAQSPHDPELLTVQSVALLSAGKNREAARIAGEAIAASPQNEQAFRVQALAYSRSKRTAEARTAAEAAVRIAPNLWQTHYVQAAVNSEDRSASALALAAVDRAIELAPGNSDALALRGTILLKSNRTHEAAAAFAAVLAENPQHRDARMGQAAALLGLSREDEASSILAGYLRDDPQSSLARYNLSIPFRRLLLSLAIAALALCAFAALAAYGESARLAAPLGVFLGGLFYAVSAYRKSARHAVGIGGYLALLPLGLRAAAVVTIVALIASIPASIWALSLLMPWSVLLVSIPVGIALIAALLVNFAWPRSQLR